MELLARVDVTMYIESESGEAGLPGSLRLVC